MLEKAYLKSRLEAFDPMKLGGMVDGHHLCRASKTHRFANKQNAPVDLLLLVCANSIRCFHAQLICKSLRCLCKVCGLWDACEIADHDSQSVRECSIYAMNYGTPELDAGHNRTVRNLSALPITDTDERLIAAAANIGEIRSPKNG